MKIALAFYGLPRCMRVTWPAIGEKLIEPLAAQGELRVFHHLYVQERVVNSRSGEDHALDPSNYRPFEAFEGIFEKPDDCLPLLPYEALKVHGDAWRDGFQSLRNIVLQLHSLRRVTALAAAWQPDVFVFARPDQLYHDAVAAADVARAAERPRSVHLPNWQWWRGLNDRFGICGSEAAMPYGNRLLQATAFCERRKEPMHAERLLRSVLALERMEVTPIPLRASRVRTGGDVVAEDFRLAPALAMARKGLRGP